MMEAKCFLEIYVDFNWITRRFIPEPFIRNLIFEPRSCQKLSRNDIHLTTTLSDKQNSHSAVKPSSLFTKLWLHLKCNFGKESLMWGITCWYFSILWIPLYVFIHWTNLQFKLRAVAIHNTEKGRWSVLITSVSLVPCSHTYIQIHTSTYIF